jgi:hypothetical protein
MTNNQIPMTNEKDNDQFTNNQLNQGKGPTESLYRFLFGYWLFSVSLVIGIWSLGHCLLQKRSTSSDMEDLPVPTHCFIKSGSREVDYPGQQWVMGDGKSKKIGHWSLRFSGLPYDL